MQVRNAAAPGRLSVALNGSPQRWPSGTNDLRHGALKVVAANPIDPLERADKPVASGRDMRRPDADDGPAGHHEHPCEIGERRNSTPRDLLDASMGGGVGRDQRRGSNLVVHGATSLFAQCSSMYMQAVCA